MLQSRMTVSGEIFKTSAVSFTVRPPKKRSSTTLLLSRIVVGQLGQCLFQVHQLRRHVGRNDKSFFQRQSVIVSPTFEGVVRAGKVNENAPHQPRADREEVGAILPTHVLELHQPQVDLVDERRGLQRVTFIFPGHLAARQAVQFVVDQGRQVLQGGLVPVSPGSE